MAKAIIMGVNFLHRHLYKEDVLKLEPNHVIVDKQDWEDVLRFFKDHPENIPLLDYTHIKIKDLPK